jgi:hypothetical protein
LFMKINGLKSGDLFPLNNKIDNLSNWAYKLYHNILYDLNNIFNFINQILKIHSPKSVVMATIFPSAFM